jgi:hypothetical protein
VEQREEELLNCGRRGAWRYPEKRFVRRHQLLNRLVTQSTQRDECAADLSERQADLLRSREVVHVHGRG